MSEIKRQAPKDIAILSGPTEDGQGARVVRIREGGDVSAGEIRPVREGEPLNHSELVRLRPLDASQRVCEVEVLHAPEKPEKSDPQQAQRATRSRDASSSSGPARVSNARYRKNWSAIFESDASSHGVHDASDIDDVSSAHEAGSPNASSGQKPDWSLN